jgi:hypothetical protein
MTQGDLRGIFVFKFTCLAEKIDPVMFELLYELARFSDGWLSFVKPLTPSRTISGWESGQMARTASSHPDRTGSARFAGATHAHTARGLLSTAVDVMPEWSA